MTELVDVVLDSEVVHFLGQVDEAGPRDDGRQHQVVDVMLTACSSKNKLFILHLQFGFQRKIIDFISMRLGMP